MKLFPIIIDISLMTVSVETGKRLLYENENENEDENENENENVYMKMKMKMKMKMCI